MKYPYRPEVDGLRAVAVIPVIFFHAGLTIFPGGFVGVDIFFVISGYLITSTILKEQESNSFSIANFYMRRARRILPALWLVTTITLPFAWLWLLPEDLYSFSGSVLSIPYFVSNIFFWNEIGYFNVDAELKPLLHTWSLAVEEQYYLLFPALLIITRGYGRKFQLGCLLTISCMSLLLSEWGWRNAESANFYLAPTRAWEILIGSILAYMHFRPGVKVANLISLTGLVLIVSSLCIFDVNTPSPSVYLLIPVMGTVFIIFGAIPGTFVNRLLSIRLCVFLGLISYSLYLFHQPILAFWRIRTQETLSGLDILFIIIATIFCATLAWKYIEVPLRKAHVYSARKFLIINAVCIFVLTTFGVYVIQGDGVPDRLPNAIAQLEYQKIWNNDCLFQVSDGPPLELPVDECQFNKNMDRTFAIWGDSIAAALAPSIAFRLAQENTSLLQFTHGHCAPILGVERAHHRWSSNCQEFNEVVIDQILRNEVEVVILAANWSDFFTSEDYYFDRKLISGKSGILPLFVAQLTMTIERLTSNNIEVVLVYPLVKSSKNVIHYVQQSRVFDDSWPEVNEDREKFMKDAQASYEILNSFSNSILRIYPEQAMCELGVCNISSNGKLLLADRIHPTKYGAEILAEQITVAIAKHSRVKR